MPSQQFEIITAKKGDYDISLMSKKHRLEILYIENQKEKLSYGDIWLARVENNEPSLGLAFLDLGDGQKAVMRYKNAAIEGRKHIRVGDVLPVQITSLPHNNGYEDKPARASMRIGLSGALLVYMPLSRRIGFSRNFPVLNRDKDKYSGLCDRYGGGWILRGPAAAVDMADLLLEAEDLHQRWQHVFADSGKSADNPQFLLKGDSVLKRVLDESLALFPDQINLHISSDDSIADELLIEKYRHIIDIKETDSPLELADFSSEISLLFEPYIELSGGGSLIIEETAALTAIDVNSENVKDHLKLNKTAIKEAARQIKLRNIGGNILLDIIHDDKNKNKHKDEYIKLIREALAHDIYRPIIHGMSHLSLLEISRPRKDRALRDFKEVFEEILPI